MNNSNEENASVSDEKSEAKENGLSGAIDKLLSNPAALSSILGMLKSPDKKLPDAPATESKSGEAISALLSGDAGGSDVLSGLLSNPEILSKLPAMIETLKPILSNASENKSSAVPNSSERKTASDSKKRIALLSALKPYMSKERCEAIDYIIKISQLTDMFK